MHSARDLGYVAIGGGGGPSQGSRGLPGQRSTWARPQQAADTILGLSWWVWV